MEKNASYNNVYSVTYQISYNRNTLKLFVFFRSPLFLWLSLHIKTVVEKVTKENRRQYRQ